MVELTLKMSEAELHALCRVLKQEKRSYIRAIDRAPGTAAGAAVVSGAQRLIDMVDGILAQIEDQVALKLEDL